MLKKLDELYNKIISESIINLPKLYLEKGYFFAPKTPFQITSDMMVDLGTYDEEARPYAGKVTDILSNNEIIYEIIGTYSDDAKFKGLNNFPIIIKYTLSPNEQYYVFTNDENSNFASDAWKETTFIPSEVNDEIETEDGEGAACGCGDAGAVGADGGAGITTNSVFGCGNSAGESLTPHAHKDPNGPGITTADLKAMYTLSLNPKRKGKKYPVFKRVKVKNIS